MSVLKYFPIFAFSILSMGCGSYVQSPVGNGALFTNVKSPISATSNGSDAGSSASYRSWRENSSATPLAIEAKKDEASCYSILGLVAFGDASIDTARQNGSIRKITHVDQNSFSVLGLFLSIKPLLAVNNLSDHSKFHHFYSLT